MSDHLEKQQHTVIIKSNKVTVILVLVIYIYIYIMVLTGIYIDYQIYRLPG